jgi:protein-export membrane protein SecD
MKEVNKRYTICLIVTLLIISSLLNSCTIEQNIVNPSLSSSASPSRPPSTEKGVTILLEADLTKTSANDREIVMTQIISIITKRLDTYGVAGPKIQQQGDNRILIQLPVETDTEEVKALVDRTGYLEFRVVEQHSWKQVVTLEEYLLQSKYNFINTTETGSRIFTISTNNNTDKETYLTVGILYDNNGVITLTDTSGNPVDGDTLIKYGDSISWIPARSDDGTQLTGAYLTDAQAIMDSSSAVYKPAINIKWNDEGSVMFDQIAARLHNPAGMGGSYSLEYVLGIFLDNNLLSAPQMTSSSYGGSGVISGNFSLAEADTMANLMESKALPVPVKVVEVNGVTQ